MTAQFSAEELAANVNAWCQRHGVCPANGQAGDSVSVRSIRYYRGLGLLDAPTGAERGFGEKHRLQLVAIRLLQAQGLPLTRIHQLLFGRSLEDLRTVERKGLGDLARMSASPAELSPGELWSMTPLTEDFLLISRRGLKLSRESRERLIQALHGEDMQGQTHGNARGNERNMR